MSGQSVNSFVSQLVPNPNKDDIIIDGKSLINDGDRRTYDLHKQGILFIGSGVSGGEEGARHGQSLMPGSNQAS